MTRMEKTKLAAAMMLGALALSACAPTVRLTSWKINQPEELKACKFPRLPTLLPGATVGEMDLSTKLYSIEQAAYLRDCSVKTAANTALIDKHNELVSELTRKPWWRFW